MAFDEDPEAQMRQLNSRRGELERALAQHENDNQQQRAQFEQAKRAWRSSTACCRALTCCLMTRWPTAAKRFVSGWKKPEAARFLHQHGAKLSKLEPLVAVLQSDPQQHEQLTRDYQQAQQQQREARQQALP